MSQRGIRLNALGSLRPNAAIGLPFSSFLHRMDSRILLWFLREGKSAIGRYSGARNAGESMDTKRRRAKRFSLERQRFPKRPVNCGGSLFWLGVLFLNLVLQWRFCPARRT